MKNTLDGINGRLDITEEKISEFEDLEEKTQQKQAEMTARMELTDRVVQVAAINHGVRLCLMLTSSYCCDCYLNLA